jgi:hypothetical protein
MKAIISNTKYLFGAAVVLMIFVCYRFGFKNTISALQLNKQLKAQASQSTNHSYNHGYLQRKQVNLSRIINNYAVDTVSYRQIMSDKFALVAEKCNVRLSSLPITNNITIKDGRYLQQQVLLSGDYYSLLNFLHELETINGLGAIRSVKFIDPMKNKQHETDIQLSVFLYGIK